MTRNADHYEERPLKRNDPCHCGSGKKYKQCHMRDDLETGQRYTYHSAPIHPIVDLNSLKENTLDFIECLRGDLGIVFDRKKGQGFVIGDVSDGAIKRTYGRLPYLFPHKAPYSRICNSIADSHLSGFYWGSPNVNRVATHLARYSLYTPHIIVTNPFCDMMRYHLDVSPLDNPGAWRQQVVNKAMFLVSIEPWIREGVITLLPPLKWTDWSFFRDKLSPLAQARFEDLTDEQHSALEYRHFLEFARCFHPDDLPWFIESFMEGAPQELVEGVVRIVCDEFATNPVRYKWAQSGQNQIVGMGSSHNLESAVFTSELCKAYLLFGEEEYQREYKFASTAPSDSQICLPDDALTQLSHAFAQLEFSFLNSIELDFALELRKDGKLSRLRSFLSDLWKRVSSVDGIENLNVDAAFREELTDQYERYKEEWSDIHRRVGRHALASAGEAVAAVVSGRLEFAVALAGVAGFQLKQLLDAYDQRRKHGRLPLGIFLQLEKAKR